MERDALRNKLFEKYFTESDGMPLRDFLNQMKPVIEQYQKLQNLLLKNGEDYKKFFKVKKIKKIFYKNNEYLIINARVSIYFIIDINNKKSLTKDEAKSIFTEEFFIDNFDEREGNYWFYDFLKYNGDVTELISFFKEQEQYFSLQPKIKEEVEVDCAWSYISIDLAGDAVQLGFRTEDQFLYETLLFDISLTPFSMQDAGQKMGLEKMKELFSKIGDCIIPKEILDKYPNINQNDIIIRKRVNPTSSNI